jgi:hypothetical protein
VRTPCKLTLSNCQEALTHKSFFCLTDLLLLDLGVLALPLSPTTSQWHQEEDGALETTPLPPRARETGSAPPLELQSPPGTTHHSRPLLAPHPQGLPLRPL